MFAIEACEERKIGLVRFYGELTESDFEALELEAAGRSIKDVAAYDVIYDMSGVEHAHLATDFISKRGALHRPTRLASGCTWSLRMTLSCWCGFTRPVRRWRVGSRP
jgi:hypothetical protein